MSEEDKSHENENNEEEEKDGEGEEEGEGEGEEEGEGEGEGEGEDEDEGEGEGEEEGGGEGEEKEDEDNENEEEGEKEDDEEGDENDEEEEDEGGDEKDSNKNKKKTKGKKVEIKEENGGENIKFPETKLSPRKEIKMDLNLNLNNSSNLFSNVNDIVMGTYIPKKSSLQLLNEISSDMDNLSLHLEKVLPSPKLVNIDNNIVNISSFPIPNFDKEDFEIKKLIDKANNMVNNSILNTKNDINNSISKEVKTYEDKGCQSDEELENTYSEQNGNDWSHQDYYNSNNRNIRFPYDPYKHLDYYNDLRNNGNYYRGNNNSFRRLGNLTEKNVNNEQIRSMNYKVYNTENNNREFRYQRYKPGSITQAMDILLDKK